MDKKLQAAREYERMICEREHQELRVPHNGFGWTGSRCSRCGFMFFKEWEPWALTYGQSDK